MKKNFFIITAILMFAFVLIIFALVYLFDNHAVHYWVAQATAEEL